MEKLIVVRTLSELKELKSYLKDKDFIAYDTETDGVEKQNHIIGFSVCAEVDVAYYVILSYWDVKTQKLIDLETMQGAKDFLQVLKNKNLIMQNAVFDCWMTNNNFQIDLMPYVHTDTLILGHVLNENRSNGLKERGVELYGEDVRAEQNAMKESVHKNGGMLTKDCYELYKADADLIAYYGAKDAILTLKIFFNDVPILFEQGLDSFFYEEESMPLLRGPTYELNTAGLKVDPGKLQKLKFLLETECAEAKAFIEKEVNAHVIEKFPGTGKTNHFNIGASQQLAWLLFIKLGNDFNVLTKGGRELCKTMNMKLPYTRAAKKEFIQMCIDNKDHVYKEGYLNKKTDKNVRPKKIGDPWKYMACGKESLSKMSDRYKWVEKLLEYKKNLKLLNTYVEGIQSRMQYGIIRPSFLQHGTTSGRYSSKNPNFQNLPREDKRVKSCIVARKGRVLIGADYSQLEPRVFASRSGDERLVQCFANGEDFHSVIGVDVFGRQGCSLKKEDKNSYAKLYSEERELAKKFDLAAVYGATPPRLAMITTKTIEEMEETLDRYFNTFPSVYNMMLNCHEQAKKEGVVYNLFGRPRRMPKAMSIPELFGNTPYNQLPYEYRNILNLATNHTIQSTGASIVNRAAIAFYKNIRAVGIYTCYIVMQIHDELIVECDEADKDVVIKILKESMENTTQLPGVALVAQPVSGYNLAELKG